MTNSYSSLYLKSYFVGCLTHSRYTTNACMTNEALIAFYLIRLQKLMSTNKINVVRSTQNAS